jgi:prepilin-type N-terminal cleavage/methylation domain-containing protein
MRKDRGFTLIELMIVIAIIAIIAAIAIPSLLKSKISANEKSAISTLRNLVTTEEQWKQGDPDRNGLADYWTADVSGLYRVENPEGDPIKEISFDVARADYCPLGNGTEGLADLDSADRAVSKAGYFYAAFVQMLGSDLNETHLPDGDDPYLNTNKFAFQAFPEVYDTTGRNAFIVCQEGRTIWRRDALLNPEGDAFGPFNDSDTKEPLGSRGEYQEPPVSNWGGAPQESQFGTLD